MTRFILGGGYTSRAPDGGKALCRAMVATTPGPVRILDCFFARTRQTWEADFEEDKLLFARHLPTRDIRWRLALEDTFLDDIVWADILYLRGGYSALLEERLGAGYGWTDRLSGKTVAGVSAGACVLTETYLDLDEGGHMKPGFALLPVKLLVHYRSEYGDRRHNWDRLSRDLDEYGPRLPLIKLREGEFVTIER